MSHWTETFFGEHFREFGFDIQAPEKTRLEAEFIAEALGISPGDKVLDLCCGVGRHSLVLAEMGYDVTGIDLTKYYIECAEKSTSKLGLNCNFLTGDMRNIPFVGEFDAIFNYFTSWGYYSSEEDLEVLRQVTKALKPGGRFLLEVMSRDWIMREFIPLDFEIHGNHEMIQYRRFDPETSMMLVEYIYLENRKVVRQDSVDLRIYSLHEIYELYRRAGLKPVQAWGEQQGGPFIFDKSKRCVVLGLK